MGRNPAVGRQGPAHHAATIPSEDAASSLAVKQIRSEIGHAETMRRTLRALGLRHHQGRGEREPGDRRPDSQSAGSLLPLDFGERLGPAGNGSRRTRWSWPTGGCC